MNRLANGLNAIPSDRLDGFVARFRRRLAHASATATGCICWPGSKRKRGYGEIDIEFNGRRLRLAAHRVAFEVERGPVPPDQTLDHTCRNTSCVNPAHLEIVTRTVNTVRQMAAIHGSDPGQVCGSGHVGEYRRDPRTNKLYCRGCHRDRWRRLHGQGIAYRKGVTCPTA